MTANDPLANVLSHMNNNEKVGKKEITTENNSRMIRTVLEIMQDEGFIGGYEEIENNQGNSLKVHLTGSLNECGVISPRFKVQVSDYEKYEKRFLPARTFGVLIVSTNKGLMTNEEAKKQNRGGRLISYAY